MAVANAEHHFSETGLLHKGQSSGSVRDCRRAVAVSG